MTVGYFLLKIHSRTNKHKTKLTVGCIRMYEDPFTKKKTAGRGCSINTADPSSKKNGGMHMFVGRTRSYGESSTKKNGRTYRYSIKILENVSCEYNRWVVETQLCKLRDT